MPLSPPGPLVGSQLQLTTIYYIYIPNMVINCLSTGERSLRTDNGDDDGDSPPHKGAICHSDVILKF